MKIAVPIAALLLAAAPAHALNKCVGADGRVTYQEHYCSNDTKSNEVKIWGNSSNSDSSQWRFEKTFDQMKGKTACFARSPIVTPKPGPNQKFLPIHAMIIVLDETEEFAIRTSSDNDLFHNDLSGMGIKTNRGKFTPITVKAGSHVIGIGNSQEFIKELENSADVSMRVRFWPYDQLYDMTPLTLAGMRSALKQARACAKK